MQLTQWLSGLMLGKPPQVALRWSWVRLRLVARDFSDFLSKSAAQGAKDHMSDGLR